MNKITKVGVTALCGSLAAISAANAGALTVAGSATVTYTQNDGIVTGNPIGMNSGITFTGTGELDNGSVVTLTITGADQDTYSAGSLTVAIPGFGTLGIDQSGSGLDAIDDMMPTAWEETNGTGLTNTLVTVGGVGGSTNLQWSADSGMLPDGMSLSIAHAPTANGGMVNDKTGSGAGDNIGQAGWDIVLQHSGAADGLNIFAGMSSIDQNQGLGRDGDRDQWSVGATYAMGGFTLGYQIQEDDRNISTASTTTSYENEAYGISFAVNDDLSISYGRHQSNAIKNTVADVELDGSSFQIAYTMGGASIKIADSSVDNNAYSTTAANQKDGTTVSLTLAF